MFLHKLASSPHRRRTLMISDCMAGLPNHLGIIVTRRNVAETLTSKLHPELLIYAFHTSYTKQSPFLLRQGKNHHQKTFSSMRPQIVPIGVLCGTICCIKQTEHEFHTCRVVVFDRLAEILIVWLQLPH